LDGGVRGLVHGRHARAVELAGVPLQQTSWAPYCMNVRHHVVWLAVSDTLRNAEGHLDVSLQGHWPHAGLEVEHALHQMMVQIRQFTELLEILRLYCLPASQSGTQPSRQPSTSDRAGQVTLGPMPSQSARSCALATAVDSPTKRTPRAVCAAMYRMRDTMTSRMGPLHTSSKHHRADSTSP
jgi:hypothetical protein